MSHSDVISMGKSTDPFLPPNCNDAQTDMVLDPAHTESLWKQIPHHKSYIAASLANSFIRQNAEILGK